MKKSRQKAHGFYVPRAKKYPKYQKSLVLLFLAFFVWVQTGLASVGNILVTEIMYDPKGVDTGQSDWIELYNSTSFPITIVKSTFGLIDEEELKMGNSGKYLNCHDISEDLTLSSGEYAILANNTEDFSSVYKDLSVKVRKVSFSLLGDGDTIRLSNDKCATFGATIRYDKSWGGSDNGKTLELVDLSGGYEKDNWQESFVDGGSPGEKHSIFVPTKPPEPKIYSDEIYINEMYPHTNTGEEEFVELYNTSNKKQDLEGWFLKDRAEKICFLTGNVMDPNVSNFLVIKNNSEKNCTLALNDTQGETLGLYNPADKDPVSSVSYEGSAKKGVSYSFNGSDWHWTRFLTPEGENKFENVPVGTLDIDEDVFVNVYANFAVLGLSKSAKVAWEFGDGHGSSLQKTRHKYDTLGKYEASVKFSDGSEDVTKKFTIEVGEVPHPNIKIVSINANPKGVDTGNETLTLENKEKKKINLNGWSIATGWKKKFINHPIREDFVIKGKKQKEINSDFSSFTLNNTKAEIQLRYPDGKIASSVKYKSPNKSVADGEVYRKVKNGWSWIASKETITKKQPAHIATQSVAGGETNNNQDTTTNIQTDTEIPVENNVVEPVVEAREEKIKLSVVPKWNSMAKIELISAQPRVLGASTVREIDGIYFLAPPSEDQEHYLLKFLKSIPSYFNLKLNIVLNNLFN